jgi:flagellar hook protein FlgE
MMRSLFAGVSGIRNHQTWLDIIGNNISNVNTVGYKSSRATFAEALAQTLHSATGPHSDYSGTNPMQVGLGLKLMSVDTQFQQGGFETTGNYTDLAIQGDGFFVVSDGTQRYFTRSGAFTIDADGFMTAQGGSLRVQGYMADQLGTIANNMAPGDIQIPFGMKAQPHATEEISFFCNLDAELTESTATLTSAGATGVTVVSGDATNGAGGTHTITITGANATQGSGVGNTGGTLTDATVLGTAFPAITDYNDFFVTVDAEDPVQILQNTITATSTVGELISAINQQFSGVNASLVNGEIVLTREFYGAGTSIAISGDLADNVLAGFAYTDGLASTLAAQDSFVPSGGGSAISTALQMEADENTGLITNLTGLGNGGVTIYAPPSTANPPGGLAAGELVINTEDTTHATSIVTYDSLGAEHVVTFTFTKTAQANIWTWEAEVDEPAQTVSGNTGSITFNEDGSLQSFDYDSGSASFVFNPNNGAENGISVALDAGTIGGVDGITQFSSPTTTIAQTQDGYGMGDLTNIFIDQNGTIIGSFSNDQNITLAQIVLGDFHNPQGLLKEGGNLYRISANSGDPIYGTAQVDFGSTVNSGYVEMSNVELSKEFADMIIAQRGFQASARVISTADQMLQEVVSLKR